MHFLVGYILQFFVFFILVICVTNPFIMSWIWTHFSNAIITLVVVMAIRMVVVQIMQRTMLRGLEMQHPRWYHYWANINLVYLGLVAAAFQVRVAIAGAVLRRDVRIALFLRW